MKRKQYADELSEEELRTRLMQQKNRGRDARIASYRASGRVMDEKNAPINEDLRWNPDRGKTNQPVAPSPRPKMDLVLLFIEIISIIGIIVLLISGVQLVQNINQKAAQSMILPTLTPTPLIQALVLPGGHTPPQQGGGEGAFNENEIPEHLRRLIAAIPYPTPAHRNAEQLVRIRIPAIHVDAPIVIGDDWESLKKGVGLNPYSAPAGEDGNVILAGHNDIYGQVFRDVDQLQPGDEIILLTEKNVYTYTVQGTQVVMPDQIEVMKQTSDSTITLISCYPYLVDDKRIIITGKRY